VSRLSKSEQHREHPANLAWLMLALQTVGLRREPEQERLIEREGKDA
jgi:hypothetical protein